MESETIWCKGRDIVMNTKDFEKQIMAAQSAEEIQEIMKEHDLDYDLSQAESVFSAKQKLSIREELSEDELAAVSGCATSRDYATDGCAATVEWGSDCRVRP